MLRRLRNKLPWISRKKANLVFDRYQKLMDVALLQLDDRDAQIRDLYRKLELNECTHRNDSQAG